MNSLKFSQLNYIARYLKKNVDKDGFLYYFFSLVRRRPLSFPIAILYSAWVSRKLIGCSWPIVVRFSGKLVPVNVSAKSANVVLKGNLVIESWQNGTNPISISLGSDSSLIIDGDFTIGQGVKIFATGGASIFLGGRKKSSGSGITCDSMIMASERIHIGHDVIVAWGVYITDSDWHAIEGKNAAEPVVIGDHVWISHDVSVLKGANIGKGSIIGAKSLVIGAIPDHCLAAGAPAKTIKEHISWSR